MANDRRVNPVYRSISRPLTILGAERKLFFFAMCVGAGTFNLLGSLLGGILMFLSLYFAARWATETDPQILRFLLTVDQITHSIRPFKIQPNFYPQDHQCLSFGESSRLQRDRLFQ